MQLSRTTTRTATACLAAIALSAVGASAAHAADFTNSQPVRLSDLQRTEPYPSTLNVSGLGAQTTKVTLTIDLDHSTKSDLEMLLVGPRGQKVLVMSDAAGDSGSPVTWTFDDAAATGLTCGATASEPPSGTYKTTNCERFEGDSDALYAPAPQPPYAGALAAFNGTDPNGTWKLYVADVGSGDDGILGSWKLSIDATGSAAAPPPPGDSPPPAGLFRLVACPAGTSGGVTCRRAGRVTRITGTARGDTIVGTSGRDIINCRAGKDRVAARDGNDYVNCGSGNDRLAGGRGNDRLIGGSGSDRLFGGPGNDRLLGGPGNDRLAGDPGRDRLSGGPGNDRLAGGRGRDRLSGGPGRNRVRQ